MTPFTILAGALQAVPPIVRQGLLVLWALAIVAVGGLEVADVATGKANDVLLYIGLYLGVQSAANVDTVGPTGDVEELPEAD
ncbi:MULTISPECIES: hypothetical protein [unclassified Aeromicrobium]|uniref:hypothetical protein n=1 Tax=unclassified Aeromicrobium TaxID=2633570 RepID=UPI00288C2125|nr:MULTISPECIES: hypothetical protein [unclassified Aeromicrobium]